MNLSKSTLALAILATMSSGCASIVSGTNQPISVETKLKGSPVVGAYCKLNNDKGTWFVTTPGSITIQRSVQNLDIKCDKEGTEPGLLSVKSSAKAMAFGNILLGGPIGAGIDVVTGAAFDYPNLIPVEMENNSLIIVTPLQTIANAPAATPASATAAPAAPVAASN